MDKYSRNLMDLANKNRLCDGWEHIHQPIYHGYILIHHAGEDIIAELAYTITQTSAATTETTDEVGHIQFMSVSSGTLATTTVRYNNTHDISLDDVKNSKAELVPFVQDIWGKAIEKINNEYTSLVNFCTLKVEEAKHTITKEEKEEKRNKVVSVLSEHGWIYSFCADNGDVYTKEGKTDMILGNTNLISGDSKFDFVRDYDSNKILEFIESI